MGIGLNIYEEVKVSNTSKELEIAGKIGVVFNDPGVEDEYVTVFVNDLEECWMVSIQDLQSTGRQFKYEDFYDGTSITVSNKGDIVD